MRLIAIAVACVGVLAAGSVVEAAPKKKPPPASPEKIRADKLFEDGRRYLAAKEYALACTAFEESHKTDPAIGTQLNIALCYEEWGKLAAAHRAYVEAERLATEKGDSRAAGAKQKVGELDAKVPRLTVVVPAHVDASAVFLFDGKELAREELVAEQRVEVGKHVIEVRVPGQPAKETEVELAVGDQKTVTLDIPKPKVEPETRLVTRQAPRKKGRLYGGIALSVGGVAAIGVASFVALVARQDYTDAVADCPDRVCGSQAAFDATSDARSKANLATIVGASGVVLAGAGLYLMLSSKGGTIQVEEKITVRPMLGPESVGLAIGGRL